MSLLGGINAVAGTVQGLQSIVSTLFPDQININLPSDTDEGINVNIDSVPNISVNTSMTISNHATEDAEIITQNASKNPRRITLTCVLSNIIRLSNARTLGAAAQFGLAVALPEIGSLSNILANEEDSIITRLQDLRRAEETGSIVTILGLPEQDGIDFIIEDISDNESVETGTNSRAVDITLLEVFIGSVEEVEGEKSLFSKVVDVFQNTIVRSPSGIGGIL